MMRKTLFGMLALAAGVASAGDAWRDDLWLGRGSFWTSRVGVTVANPTDEAWEGKSVAVPVARLALAGVRVEELRLVDARGVQLEYGVWTKGQAELVTEGPVPADGEFIIPVVCPARGSATFQVYFGNVAAWGLADFWKQRTAPALNGGFEKIAGDAPVGWKPSMADATHHLSVDASARSGARCIKAQADDGAEHTWFSYTQSGIPVRAGERLTVRAQIRAKDVKGYTGWYVHAGNGEKGDILNRVFQLGAGTFDWKELKMEVTIPANCTTMTLGSVLRGTGTSWYDDVTVERSLPPPEPQVTVGAVEKLVLREIGADAAWPETAAGARAWQYRVPVRIANFTDVPREQVLSAFSLAEALHATRNPDYLLTLDGREIRTCSLGDQLLFTVSLPAKSVTTCYLYVRGGESGARPLPAEELKSALGSVIPSDQVLVKSTRVGDLAAFEALLNSSANLVRNPSWEKGTDGWWFGKDKGGIRFSVADGGRFGAKFAKMEIQPMVNPNWSGWRQNVKVQPGRMYFYGAFISGDNLTQGATVHLHQHTAKGALASGGMQSAGRGVNGTAPWTPVFGMSRATEDATSFAFQLTMNGTGTVAYDGALVAEFTSAKTGDPMFRPSTADEALHVVQMDPVFKVFRETPVEEKADAKFSICLAKNETEALQLAVRSGHALADLEVAVDLPLAFEIGRVGYVPVDHPTAYYSCTTPEWELRYPRTSGQSDGWSGWWPDPIEKTAKGPLAANTTQAIWINVKTDAATKPGTYAGTITWKADGRVVRTDAFSVKVWNFTLPARPAFPAIYDLRVGGQWKDLGATADARREKLWAFMAEKKCCPDNLGAAPVFTRGKDGNVKVDFTEYDRLATRYFDHYQFPMSYTPGCFYCFGWAMPPKKFLGEDPYEGKWPYEGSDWTKLRPEYKRVYQQALKLFWDHVKAKGWADRLTLYISDEPHFHHTNIVQQMQACCAMIHEVDPNIRIYSSTWRHCPEWNNSLDVWGVGHYGCFPTEELTARVKAGSRFWWTTDGQMCTDTPYCAVERLLPLYAHAWGADAYEFWGSTWLTYDPWKFGWHAYIRQSDTPGKTYWVRYPAGDGYLIYPPRPGDAEPVTSVRMEAARDGVEDHSYYVALKGLADKGNAQAKDLLARLHALVPIPNAGGRHSTRILPEPEKLAELRLSIGELLNQP